MVSDRKALLVVLEDSPSRGGVTPEGEPLESYSSSGYNKSLFRVIIPAVIGLIIVIVLVTASVKTVEAGHRGVLLRLWRCRYYC